MPKPKLRPVEDLPSDADEAPSIEDVVDREGSATILAAWIAESLRRGDVPGHGSTDDEDEDEEDEEDEDKPALLLHLLPYAAKDIKNDVIRSFELTEPDEESISQIAVDIVDAAAEDLLGASLDEERFVVRFEGGNGRSTFKLSLAEDDEEEVSAARDREQSRRASTGLVVRGRGTLAVPDIEEEEGEDDRFHGGGRRGDGASDVAVMSSRIVSEMLAHTSEAHQRAMDMPVLYGKVNRDIINDLRDENKSLKKEINELYEQRKKVLRMSDEVDSVKHEHALAVQKEEAKAERARRAWDFVEKLMPALIPIFIALRSGNPAMVGTILGGMGIGGSGGGGQSAPPVRSGGDGREGGGVAGVSWSSPSEGSSEGTPEPSAGFSMEGLDISVLMQVVPHVKAFLADITEEQFEDIPTGTIKLTRDQQLALLSIIEMLRNSGMSI